MQVIFIPCVIRINNRDLILSSKIQCLRSHKHRLMHMNAVKLLLLESFPDFSADQLRIYHAVFHLLTRHLKPDDIVLFHLSVAWIKSIIRCEDRHLVSLFSQFFCQPLHGNRNSADKRLIVIRKHRNLHDVSKCQNTNGHFSKEISGSNTTRFQIRILVTGTDGIFHKIHLPSPAGIENDRTHHRKQFHRPNTPTFPFPKHVDLTPPPLPFCFRKFPVNKSPALISASLSQPIQRPASCQSGPPSVP